MEIKNEEINLIQSRNYHLLCLKDTYYTAANAFESRDAGRVSQCKGLHSFHPRQKLGRPGRDPSNLGKTPRQGIQTFAALRFEKSIPASMLFSI